MLTVEKAVKIANRLHKYLPEWNVAVRTVAHTLAPVVSIELGRAWFVVRQDTHHDAIQITPLLTDPDVVDPAVPVLNLPPETTPSTVARRVAVDFLPRLVNYLAEHPMAEVASPDPLDDNIQQVEQAAHGCLTRTSSTIGRPALEGHGKGWYALLDFDSQPVTHGIDLMAHVSLPAAIEIAAVLAKYAHKRS